MERAIFRHTRSASRPSVRRRACSRVANRCRGPGARGKLVYSRAFLSDQWPHTVEELLAVSNAVCLLVLLRRQQNKSRGGSAPSLWKAAASLGRNDGGQSDVVDAETISRDRAGASGPTSEPVTSTAAVLDDGGRQGAVARPLPTTDEVWDEVTRNVVGGEAGEEGSAPPDPVFGAPGGASASAGAGGLPRLVLQSLRPSERKKLLGLSLEALRARVPSLEEIGEQKLDAEGFRSACTGVLNSCAEEAAERWLGCAPERAEGGGEDDGPWAALGQLREDKWFLYSSAFSFLARGEAYVEGSGAGESKGWTSGAATIATGCSRIVEDCVVTIAETVADAYLEEACRGKQTYGPFPVSLGPTLVHPVLSSTRKIERFRNQVGLHRILHKYFFSVRLVYEDRHALWGYRAGEGGALVQTTLELKRSAELSSLTGVRRAFGLLLEASDVVLPIARGLFDFVQEGVQVLLVLVIGRGLGLVLRGVRESVRGGKGAGRRGASSESWDEEARGGGEGDLQGEQGFFSFSY